MGSAHSLVVLWKPPALAVGRTSTVSATLFMVAGALPAGAVTVAFCDPRRANNVLAVTAVGSGWFVVIAVMVLVGIRITARVQWLIVLHRDCHSRGLRPLGPDSCEPCPRRHVLVVVVGILTVSRGGGICSGGLNYHLLLLGLGCQCESG